MDLCIFDWKIFIPIFAALIASCIASGTALYISNKWSNQKGSEVVATEAKNVAIDIEEIESIFRELIALRSKFGSSKVFVKTKIRLKELCRSNRNRLVFIAKFVGDTDKSAIIQNHLSVFGAIESKFEKISMLSNEIKKYSDFLNKVDEHDNHKILGDLQELANVSREIALYRFKLNKTKNEPMK